MDCTEKCITNNSNDDITSEQSQDQPMLEFTPSEKGRSRRCGCSPMKLKLFFFVSFMIFSGCSVVVLLNILPSGGRASLDDLFIPELQLEGNRKVTTTTTEISAIVTAEVIQPKEIMVEEEDVIEEDVVEEEEEVNWWEVEDDSYYEEDYESTTTTSLISQDDVAAKQGFVPFDTTDDEEGDFEESGEDTDDESDSEWWEDDYDEEDMIIPEDSDEVTTQTVDAVTETAVQVEKFDPPPFLMTDLQNVYLDETFSVPVDVLFNAIVGEDSTFMESHLEEQNAYEIHYGEWVPGQRQYTGHTVRKVDYKVKTDNMFISQGYVATESQQILYGSSEEGLRYAVDNVNVMDGMPYSNNFYTVIRYSMRATGKDQSELKISVVVRYINEPWGFVKTIIEGAVYGEMEKNYKIFGEALVNHFS